jgi:SRSO17 transposase
MDLLEFEQVAQRFAAFHARFSPFFGRSETRRRSKQYLQGLLVQDSERRSAENLAEAVEGATPRALQRFLSESPWPTAPLVRALQRYLGERLSEPEGVFVLDDTGFPKQGSKSVGVARQYSGTLGKVGNCQVGVFLAYVSSRGHALVDGCLYLPRHWTEDRQRCRQAGVPDAVDYQSKAELGLALLAQAKAAGHLSGSWLTADEGYGEVPSFRDALNEAGWSYVLEVPSTTPVFSEPVRAEVPAWSGRGRRPRRARMVEGEPGWQTVAAVAAGLRPSAWQTQTVAEGAQGPRVHQFASLRVWERRNEVAGREGWLVLRRNLDGSELKYYSSNAGSDTPLATLARVGAWRWPIETEFEQEKGEVGLDEYEVRGWQGWSHHITLALLAGAFLLDMQQDWGKKGAPADAAAGGPRPAGATSPPTLDVRRPVALAQRHASPQPCRQTLPCQAPSL